MKDCISDKQILITDNEPAILFAFKKLFSGNKVKVDTAETLEEAIALINKNDYNVIIADLRLTGVLGKEGLDILRYSKELKPQAKVILITGYGSPEVMEKAFTLGAAYYFEKPVTTSKLRDALKNLGINYLDTD